MPALPGFKKIQPRVFAGLFPLDSADYENFREALRKLALNDSSLSFEPEVSGALGFGMRCGFLGSAAHGDHPGAARARVQLVADLDGADRRLRGREARRRDRQGREPGRFARAEQDQGDSRADHSREHSRAAGVPRRGDPALHREARRAEAHALFGPARADRVRAAARRGRARFLRSTEVREPRLRVVRLHVPAFRGRPAREARHLDQQGEGRRDGV